MVGTVGDAAEEEGGGGGAAENGLQLGFTANVAMGEEAMEIITRWLRCPECRRGVRQCRLDAKQRIGREEEASNSS